VPRGAKPLQNKGSRRSLSRFGKPCHNQLMDGVMDSPRGVEARVNGCRAATAHRSLGDFQSVRTFAFP